MAGELNEAALAPVLTENPAVVEAALRAIYLEPGATPDLSALRVTAEASGVPLARLLADLLRDDDTDRIFVAILTHHGIDLLDEAPPAAAEGWDEAGLARFALDSRNFRCRIKVAGVVCGSGVLVSPRLVLTAEHVIAGAAHGSIEVVSADRRQHVARVAFASPHHPDEVTGGLPPTGQGGDFADVALLRLDRPLGHLYGHAELPAAAEPLGRETRFVLVHFPEGQAKGLEFGAVTPAANGEVRLRHSAASAPGSSGGAGFDSGFRFLGLHQGKWGNQGRLVPHGQFADLPDFRAEIAGDEVPRYLWSLDGTLDSHLVIGRARFFDALTAIVEGQAPMLRGVWVRRGRAGAGLTFTFRLLEAYLAALGATDLCLRVSPSLAASDLIRLLHGAAAAAGVVPAPPPEARAGVRAGETTALATDADRARALIEALQAAAQASEKPIWIHFDDPPAELDRTGQFQLEHLVREIRARHDLRLVLAGYDTYGLSGTLVQSVADARAAAGPCLMRETLGDFSRAEVLQTLRGIDAALGFGWAPAVIEDIADLALRPPIQGHAGVYDAEALGEVAARLRDEVQRRMPA